MSREDTCTQLYALEKEHAIAQRGSVDAEAAHIEADELLLDYLRAIGETEVAMAYEAARDTIGFWYA